MQVKHGKIVVLERIRKGLRSALDLKRLPLLMIIIMLMFVSPEYSKKVLLTNVGPENGSSRQLSAIFKSIYFAFTPDKR